MRAGPSWSGESAALGLGWELQGVTGRAEFLRAAGELLLRLVPADVVGWNAVGPAGVELVLFPGNDEDLPALTAGLTAVAGEHPMLISYLAEPSRPDAAPRRLSDVAPRHQLLANRAYVEFLRPVGAEHQLTVLTARPRPELLRGWALNRERGDFTERDLEVARALQTMLGLLDRAVERPGPAVESPAAERLGLTPREVEVLAHVGAGLTAEAVARLLRISMRTVRKHLENAYRKLDCHDRLVAVQRAQALGIIPGEHLPR